MSRPWTKHRNKVIAIRNRDGDRCWLCGLLLCFNLRITRKNRAGSFIYITLDHVLPASQGGSGRVENLRLAHSQCNSLRADKPADPHPRWVADKTLLAAEHETA